MCCPSSCYVNPLCPIFFTPVSSSHLLPVLARKARNFCWIGWQISSSVYFATFCNFEISSHLFKYYPAWYCQSSAPCFPLSLPLSPPPIKPIAVRPLQSLECAATGYSLISLYKVINFNPGKIKILSSSFGWCLHSLGGRVKVGKHIQCKCGLTYGGSGFSQM